MCFPTRLMHCTTMLSRALHTRLLIANTTRNFKSKSKFWKKWTYDVIMPSARGGKR